MNFIHLQKKDQPPRLHKKTTFKFRVQSFLVDNQYWLLAWVVGIGSVNLGLVLLLVYRSLAPVTIGGVI